VDKPRISKSHSNRKTKRTPLPFVEDDGGRGGEGYDTAWNGGCVTRAIAIAARLPYRIVSNTLNAIIHARISVEAIEWVFEADYHPHLPESNRTHFCIRDFKKQYRFLRYGGGGPTGSASGAALGVSRVDYGVLLEGMGWTWVETKNAHLCKEDLPAGRLIVLIDHHALAVIDHVVHDENIPSVKSKVLGYWKPHVWGWEGDQS
jgi:hypothetical protein